MFLPTIDIDFFIVEMKVHVRSMGYNTKPGVEYIFGQWQRAKQNLYLTMMPIDNLEKSPTQKRVSKLPISVKKGVTDFLNNIGKDHHF